MPEGKHKAKHRLEKPRRSPSARLAVVAAPLATVSVVGVGVAAGGLGVTGGLADGRSPQANTGGQAAPAVADLSAATARALSSSAVTGADRTVAISRNLDRMVVPKVAEQKWATADLDLRLSPGKHVETDGELDSGKRVGVTGKVVRGFAEVVVDKQVRWVTADYLADEKPLAPADLPLGGSPCAGTSGVMGGLVPAADRVYVAVCNNFPEITRYGGYDPHGEHRSGKAIDIMVSDVQLGTRIAEFLRAHAAELNLYDVIWRQRIWTPVRAGEGWRAMPNRGSATANHYDHVHVSVN